jgi:hypothetical protein
MDNNGRSIIVYFPVHDVHFFLFFDEDDLVAAGKNGPASGC